MALSVLSFVLSDLSGLQSAKLSAKFAFERIIAEDERTVEEKESRQIRSDEYGLAQTRLR